MKKIYIPLSILIISIGIFLFSSIILDDVKGVSGEVMLMQGDNAYEFNMFIYDLKNDELEERRGVYFYPQYNVNNSDHLIAVINNPTGQSIHEVISSINEQSLNKSIYSGDNIKHPKFAPDKNAISFIENDHLFYFDLDNQSLILIEKLNFPEYDWLDSNTILYTNIDTNNKYNIIAYDIKNHEKHVYRENVLFPSLSMNKKYFAYRSGEEKNVVFIEDLNTGTIHSIQIKDGSIAALKPSPDGKHLLLVKNNQSKYDVIIIEVNSNKSRTIMESFFPSSIDWKN